MIYVAESTVARVQPRLGETEVEYRGRVSRVRNSAVPCPLCNRAMFLAWRSGHTDPDHDRHDCAVCADLFGDTYYRLD
jgi:hypothetical protein